MGITILTSAKVETVTDDGGTVTVAYTAASGERSSIRADRVLMSVGFAPQVENFGLEKTGVELTPQVASFGLTEQQARDQGHDVPVAKFPLTANGKAQGMGEPAGFIKLVGDSEHGELLGGGHRSAATARSFFPS